MAGESQQTPSTEPDPSVLTTQQLDRGLAGERDYVNGQIAIVEQRLTAIDTATRLLNDTVNRVPTDVQVSVANLKELHGEKFAGVQLQFSERDTRQEREARDNKVAVDAAFAASKEASAKQDESNQKAIDKSERGFNDKQDKFAELFETRTRAIDTQIGDVKDRTNGEISELKRRLTSIEESKRGVSEARSMVFATAGFVVALLVIGSILIAAWPR